MSYGALFDQGLVNFRMARFDDALYYFTQAAGENGGGDNFLIYDSRAAVYEKLGRRKDALLDAKTVIKLAPDNWRGYSRAARLFMSYHKFNESLKMAQMALDRLKGQKTEKRIEIEHLIQEILKANNLRIDCQPARGNGIERLPLELLTEIFQLIIEEDTALLILLLCICCHWRNAILQTPSMWSTLVLTKRKPAEKLSRWMKHSRGIIRILKITKGAVCHLDWPFKLLEKLPWHDLRSCEVEYWNVATYLQPLPTVQNPFSQLEKFTLRDVLLNPSLCILLRQSQVHCLELFHVNVSWQRILSYFDKLTALKIVGSCTELVHMLHALEANPFLAHFALDTQMIVDGYFTRPSPLVLSRLTHLELAGSWASSFFEIISVPCLEVLHICSACGSLDRGFALATDHSSQLKQLILVRSCISPSVLVNFLQNKPILMRLNLVSLSEGVNQVVEALCSPSLTSHGDRICPTLSHLDVSHASDVETGPLVRLIRSRVLHSSKADLLPSTPSVSPIISLIIDGCEKIDPDWVPWFREHVPKVSCIYQSKKNATWRR